MTLSSVPKVLGRGSRMHIKEVPIGQILMLALLIMLIGIGITAMMKKANASSKARKRMFWGSVIISFIFLLCPFGSIAMSGWSVPGTWSLYPWEIGTIAKLVLGLLEIIGSIVGFLAVAVVGSLAVAMVLDCLIILIIYALDKLPPKILRKD